MSKNEEIINDPIIDLSTKQMKNDILIFKNETLKDFKEVQKRMLDKYSNLDENIKNKFESYEKRINAYEIKITELSKLINTDKTIREKVDQLMEFKEKTNDEMLTEKIRLDNFRNDLKSNVTRIDKILTESVIYPRVIGGINKHKTFHDLIDYILTQCSLNLTFREKYILDFKGYKQKLEGLIEVFNNQINKILSTTSEFTKTCVKESEEKIKSMISILEDRMSETRIENANYAIGMEKLTKTLQTELKNLYILKNDLYQKVDSSVTEIRKDNTKVIKLFSGYRKGFNLLQHKFTQLSEFIKDMRFRINLKEDVERREFSKMSDLINFDKKKKGFYDGIDDMSKLNSKGFESQLKEYISGKISAQDLLKKYNSMSNININEMKRKSFGGEGFNNFKKLNSFGNDIIESDKNIVNDLLRGSMAMPLKKMSLENSLNKNNNIKRHEEIKEEDEEDALSINEQNSGIDSKKRKSLKQLKQNLMDKNKKEKDDFYENLYEDVGVVENEEEKNNLTKQMTNNISKSKHGRGSIRNNMINISKAEKLIKNMKKLNPDINSANNINKDKDKNKIKETQNLNLNIVNNNIISDSVYSEINEDTKNNNNNKIVTSENNKNSPNLVELNNNNKSSTLYNFKMKNMGEQILNNKGKVSPKLKKIESADRYKYIKKENKFKDFDKNFKNIKMIKDSLYDSEFFLPSNIVHNATIIAYNSKEGNHFMNRKVSPEKKTKNVSEIKSASNLILTSFYPKNGKHDINADERNLLKIGNKKI